jgi:hypothetical protein
MCSAKKRAAAELDADAKRVLDASMTPMWAGETSMGCAPLEPLKLNPSSYDDQEVLLKKLAEQLLLNGRSWFWCVVDGAVAEHVQQLAHTKISYVRVRGASLHEYLTMLKSFQELAFPVLGRGFADAMGYASEKAQRYA